MTDLDGCCTLDPDHDGPCVWFCSTCSGLGECPDCEGWGPEQGGCPTCDTTGACPHCAGAGEHVDDWAGVRPLVTIELPGLSR